MIISARIVKPRKVRRCEMCDCPIVTQALRLYGAATRRDKPYVVWVHPECCESSDRKIQAALETL
jgi:hypothetical protein